MAIYLDDQTRTWMERAVNKASESDFIAKRLSKMLQADRERLELMGTCEHERAEFFGNKTCCSKCGSFYEVGMGESWSNKKYLDEKRNMK